MALSSSSHLELVADSMITNGPSIVLQTLRFLQVGFQASAHMPRAFLNLIRAPMLHTVSVEHYRFFSNARGRQIWPTWPQISAIPSVKLLLFAYWVTVPFLHELAESLPNAGQLTCRPNYSTQTPSDYIGNILGSIVQPHHHENIPNIGQDCLAYRPSQYLVHRDSLSSEG